MTAVRHHEGDRGDMIDMSSAYASGGRGKGDVGCNDAADGGGSYFVDPAVSPPTMYFCRNRKRVTTGSDAITAPAANALQSA